ncbi:MAG: hypothetical protein AUJ52_12970 [Elusimicrobia bacterium CG1_02_63_36]|nr:MAG: hypothetical protein AUJ52_12970 [Elusimicrobia bacterium CG1_02_63_36]PIP84300.1 MAG: hypothetical protein COR54_04960 [Elusimicrobia bacterium CG22_combo_CG10-13_8_21_14_all_63_91]PJA15669.1 MAG: hypothetical protein COX66_09530 [Elusimicrobia bacterium CG_4_10_14_0_2_um_filter_63_34]PJB23693.1 MAG: hypothetical protein CO113_17245 [Elusimicrobia bacterium CG_4_9_14_3_um_filter_62_55]
MNLLLATLFFLTLPGPALRAAESSVDPGRGAAVLLEDAFTEKGLTLLHRRGFVSLASTGKTRTVAFVQWPLFEDLLKYEASYREFLDLYRRNRRALAVDGSLEDLRTLQRRPLGGLMTPSLRAAVDVLAVMLREAGELDKRLAASPEGKHLMRTRWGEEFFEARSAAWISAPEAAAGEFTQEIFSRGLSESPERRHVLEHLAAVYHSEDWTRHMPAYLADQRKLWTVFETRGRLRELERSTTLRDDVKALAAVLAGLEKDRGSIERLREVLSVKTPEPQGPVVRFSGPELHIFAEDGSSTLDTGDTAVVSMAYWVYGVADGQQIDISELGFVDRGWAGIENRFQRKLRAGNGGPYTFTAKLPVRTDDAVTYRLRISADGAETLSREVEIQPSPRYREMLALAAEADREASSCMLSDALSRYDAAIEDLKPSASKPRFARLLKHVEERRRTVQRQSELRERLDAAIDGARLFASKEQCDFRFDRARNALSLLADLPAGCDAIPEGVSSSLSKTLRELMIASQRRREAQDAFDRAVKKGRELESRCRTDQAVSLYAGALALLDADDQTRCGEWEQTYTLVRIEDLPRATGAARIEEALRSVAADAEKKFAEGDVRGALELLLPNLAKVEALPDASCYDSSKGKLAELAETYGAALTPGSMKKGSEAAGLSKDDPGSEVQSVLKEKARRDSERRAAAAAQRERQAPSTAAPEGP